MIKGAVRNTSMEQATKIATQWSATNCIMVYYGSWQVFVTLVFIFAIDILSILFIEEWAHSINPINRASFVAWRICTPSIAAPKDTNCDTTTEKLNHMSVVSSNECLHITLKIFLPTGTTLGLVTREANKYLEYTFVAVMPFSYPPLGLSLVQLPFAIRFPDENPIQGNWVILPLISNYQFV